jgi:hypothetical protein
MRVQREKAMRAFVKLGVASALLMLVFGCAIPPAVSIASLVADGASYVSSGKSVTDHGISALFGEDCALLRIFDGKICRETPEYETTVAVLQPQTPATTDILARVDRVPLGGPAPVAPVTSEPLGSAAPLVRTPVQVETTVVASSGIGDPLRLGVDPLRDLQFRPDRSFGAQAVRIGRAPAAEPWADRAAAALADLHAQASGFEING